MSPATPRLILRAAAIGGIALASGATASVADAPLPFLEQQSLPVTFELIDTSRLGCGQGVTMWTVTTGTQCAFDTATRGALIGNSRDWSRGTIEAYSAVAHATAGAFTPDQLLLSPDHRSTEATDFLLLGLKGSAFDERLKFTTEFASTRRIFDHLLDRNWTRQDGSVDSGTSAKIRVEARLISAPRHSWSVTAEMRSVTDDYQVGRSGVLARYAAMPGTRLALSSKARVGELGITAGLEQLSTPYSRSSSRKAGLDVHGISLRLVSRDASLKPLEGSSLLGSATRTTSTYLDVDSNMLAMSLLPDLDQLPFLVPSMVSLSLRTGETENRFATSTDRYGRSSLGIDGTWETPIGETLLSYWRDGRIGLTSGTQSRSTEMMQVSHFVSRGNWRFGVDASLLRGSGEGSSGYDEQSWSFGQSIAYSAPAGPELRLALGQDRGRMRLRDDSLAMFDNYSSVTASLDLSRYLQKRFERPDLRLTVDYRKAVERTDETSLYGELVERWVDGDRREGLLLSFGMKL